jgi:hypothetical protein
MSVNDFSYSTSCIPLPSFNSVGMRTDGVKLLYYDYPACNGTIVAQQLFRLGLCLSGNLFVLQNDLNLFSVLHYNSSSCTGTFSVNDSFQVGVCRPYGQRWVIVVLPS